MSGTKSSTATALSSGAETSTTTTASIMSPSPTSIVTRGTEAHRDLTSTAAAAAGERSRTSAAGGDVKQVESMMGGFHLDGGVASSSSSPPLSTKGAASSLHGDRKEEAATPAHFEGDGGSVPPREQQGQQSQQTSPLSTSITSVSSQQPAAAGKLTMTTTEVMSKLLQQLEYYFSIDNLHRDTFLTSVMSQHQGYVPLKLVGNFSKVRRILQSDNVPVNCQWILQSAQKARNPPLHVVCLNTVGDGGDPLWAIGPVPQPQHHYPLQQHVAIQPPYPMCEATADPFAPSTPSTTNPHQHQGQQQSYPPPYPYAMVGYQGYPPAQHPVMPQYPPHLQYYHQQVMLYHHRPPRNSHRNYYQPQQHGGGRPRQNGGNRNHHRSGPSNSNRHGRNTNYRNDRGGGDGYYNGGSNPTFGPNGNGPEAPLSGYELRQQNLTNQQAEYNNPPKRRFRERITIVLRDMPESTTKAIVMDLIFSCCPAGRQTELFVRDLRVDQRTKNWYAKLQNPVPRDLLLGTVDALRKQPHENMPHLIAKVKMEKFNWEGYPLGIEMYPNEGANGGGGSRRSLTKRASSSSARSLGGSGAKSIAQEGKHVSGKGSLDASSTDAGGKHGPRTNRCRQPKEDAKKCQDDTEVRRQPGESSTTAGGRGRLSWGSPSGSRNGNGRFPSDPGNAEGDGNGGRNPSSKQLRPVSPPTLDSSQFPTLGGKGDQCTTSTPTRQEAGDGGYAAVLLGKSPGCIQMKQEDHMPLPQAVQELVTHNDTVIDEPTDDAVEGEAENAIEASGTNDLALERSGKCYDFGSTNEKSIGSKPGGLAEVLTNSNLPAYESTVCLSTPQKAESDECDSYPVKQNTSQEEVLTSGTRSTDSLTSTGGRRSPSTSTIGSDSGKTDTAVGRAIAVVESNSAVAGPFPALGGEESCTPILPAPAAVWGAKKTFADIVKPKILDGSLSVSQK